MSPSAVSFQRPILIVWLTNEAVGTDAAENEGRADNDYQPAANNNPMHQIDSQKDNLKQPLGEIINYKTACCIADLLPEPYKGTE